MLALSLAVSSCTVAIKPAQQGQASLDSVPDETGNYQNSGVLCWTNHQILITPTARDRYNALCVKYGARLTPPVKPDDGLTPDGTNRWLMDKAHLSAWATMTTWANNAPALVKPP